MELCSTRGVDWTVGGDRHREDRSSSQGRSPPRCRATEQAAKILGKPQLHDIVEEIVHVGMKRGKFYDSVDWTSPGIPKCVADCPMESSTQGVDWTVGWSCWSTPRMELPKGLHLGECGLGGSVDWTVSTRGVDRAAVWIGR